jgi:hypothetical protein
MEEREFACVGFENSVKMQPRPTLVYR